MSRDKERFQDDWEETAEDSYPRQQRLQRQKGKQSPQRSQRPQQSSQQPPRQSQYFPEEYDTETPVRRTPPHSRRSERLPDEYYENHYPSRQSQSRLRQDYQDDYETEAPVRRTPLRREEIETDPLRRRRVRPAARPARRRETRPLPKERRVWPWLLLGCAGGILLVAVAAAIVIATTFHIVPVGNVGGILSQNTYKQPGHQVLSISHLSQMQVHNQIGDISILLDPNANQLTVDTLKKVKASSQDEANKEFNSIPVAVQQPTTDSLTVMATLANQNGAGLANNGSVDITITLPFSTVGSPSTTGTPTLSTFDIATSTGNITVDSNGVFLSGTLSIKVDTGNISVRHADLANGSHLQTGRGNVTFDGSLNTSSSSSSSPAKFKISSEVGKLDVTLPATTNVTLDANTNVGKITSDFDISPQSNDGAMSYYGPLISNAAAQPTAVLTLDMSTGDINLHKVAAG